MVADIKETKAMWASTSEAAGIKVYFFTAEMKITMN